MGLGEQCPDTVGAGGLLPHCVSLGERLLPCTPPGDTVYLTQLCKVMALAHWET